MGRSSFQRLLKEVEDPSFLSGLSTLYVYGPSGTGKSHLLAVLVYYLVWKGERVFSFQTAVISSMTFKARFKKRYSSHFATTMIVAS